jgi:hypothetical protein
MKLMELISLVQQTKEINPKNKTRLIYLKCQIAVFSKRHKMLFNFLLNLCSGTLGTAATTGLLYQPRMIGDGDCEEIGGIKIGRENRSTRRNPALAQLCPPQIPHD